MITLYDWITMALFGCIAIIFLNRSVEPARESDRTYHYLPPAIGCALADYSGNHGLGGTAILLTIVVVAYVLFVLRPLDRL